MTRDDIIKLLEYVDKNDKNKFMDAVADVFLEEVFEKYDEFVKGIEDDLDEEDKGAIFSSIVSKHSTWWNEADEDEKAEKISKVYNVYNKKYRRGNEKSSS